jgi:hypothetical protein
MSMDIGIFVEQIDLPLENVFRFLRETEGEPRDIRNPHRGINYIDWWHCGGDSEDDCWFSRRVSPGFAQGPHPWARALVSIGMRSQRARAWWLVSAIVHELLLDIERAGSKAFLDFDGFDSGESLTAGRWREVAGQVLQQAIFRDRAKYQGHLQRTLIDENGLLAPGPAVWERTRPENMVHDLQLIYWPER